MNFRTTLILLVLLAVVAGYFVLFERGRPTTYEYETRQFASAGEQGSPLFDGLAASDITRITIDRRGAVEVLAREDGGWIQVEPVRFPLTGATLDEIAEQAAALRSVESFTPSSESGSSGTPSLADVSLDRPRVAVALATGETTHTIRLGKQSTGGLAYATVDDDATVHIVGDALHTALLDTRATSWRQKALDAPPIAQLDRIHLRRDDQDVVARKIDGRWFLDDRATQRADDTALSSLMTSLGGIYVKDFVTDAPDDLGVYGLTQPRLELTIARPGIDDGDERRQTLRVGGAADLNEESYYATWSTPQTAPEGEASSVVFTIAKSHVDSLAKSRDDLRDSRIVLADPQDVREVRIERRVMDDLLFQRTPQEWTFAEPSPPFDVDHQAVQDLVKSLADLRAQGFAPVPQANQQPAATVTLHRRGESAPQRIVFFGSNELSEEATYVAVRDGETIGHVIAAEDLATLFMPASALRDKMVLNVTPQQIVRVDLHQPDGTELTFARDEGDDAVWQLTGSANFEIQAFNRLLRSLAPLKVETWTTTRQSFEPDITLTLHLDDGTSRVVRIESATGRGMTDGAPLFGLPASITDLLTAEYRDRLALPLTLEQIQSVTLTSGDRSETLTRGADSRYINGQGESVDQTQAASVFDTLAGLRVERWLPLTEAGDGEAALELVIASGEGATRTLRLTPDNRTGNLAGEDRSFLLSADDVEKLTAPIVE